MKPILAFLVLTVALSLEAAAQDVRSKVGPTSGTSLTNILDPDKSVYGVPWGSSEDEFISRFGNPTGYIKLNGAETAMLYGKSHAFIFTASKLSGLRISFSMIDWKLAQTILTLTPFDGIRWQLSNGIRRDLNLAEVKKILADRLREDHPGRYQFYFNSDSARIEIEFSHSTNDGERDESYKVFGIYIRQAASASAADAIRKAPVLAPKRVPEPIPDATRLTERKPAAAVSDTDLPASVAKARASMALITGEDSAGQPIVVGTGFVIGENLIATNTGVGFAARRVHIGVAGSEPQTLEVASHDSYRDVTILNMKRTPSAARQAPPLQLASDTVVAKEKVYFSVNPGPQSSVFEGAIRGSSASNDLSRFLEISVRTTSSTNGGGPLFNRNGEVIGILLGSQEGKNHYDAIPVSFLKTLLQSRTVAASGSGDPGANRPAGAAPDQAGGGNPQEEPTSLAVDTRPVCITNPQPRYTEQARRNKTQGVVTLSILVGEDGEVKQTRIQKGLPDGLNEQAVAASYQLKFRPATRNGKAVSLWISIGVEFHLR